MYKLPKDIDLNFLKEKELESVSIAFNSLILNFDEPIRITINSKCTFRSNTGTVIEIEDYPREASLICQLLGKKIVNVGGNELGTLMLTFESEEIFSIYDDSDSFESYIIKSSDNEIIV